MKSSTLFGTENYLPLRLGLAALAITAGWLSATFSSHGIFLALVCAGLLYLMFALLTLREPIILVIVFLTVLVVLPPFFFRQTGETPVYVSSFLLPLALAIVVVRWSDFQFHADPIARGLFLFLFGTATSLPFAWWFSGSAIAIPSLLRWLMLAQTLLLYVLVRGGTRACPGRAERWLIPILIIAAVMGAGYGIYDFIWPVPMPHPAAPQFLYLPNGLVRRAQGVLYESSSFGNLCGFFLAVTAAAFMVRREKALGVSSKLLPPFILVLAGAVIVAFSRSSWANTLVTLMVFGVLTRGIRWRRTIFLFAALGVPLVVLALYFPEVWNYFLGYRLGSLSLLFSDPNSASSGRYKVWTHIFSILYKFPHYFLLGVGYKTLPFTRLFGREIITDNGFLNLLLETGILGLGGFLVFLASSLKSLWKLSRSPNPLISFWAKLLFAFWCGQGVQLMVADAYTYWRNMVVYVSLLALVMNWADREEMRARQPGGVRTQGSLC
ncbi:MAG TPA: O-antigen ligase family protein [Terriglobia bacterium]|nr:O-antigen ligase family protein [Terriglobia bacterium]